MVMFQILLDGAEPCDAGTTQLSSAVYRYVTGKSSRSHTEMIYPPADGHPSQCVCRIEQLYVDRGQSVTTKPNHQLYITAISIKFTVTANSSVRERRLNK